MKDNYEFLTTTINGHILEITINRPDVMNALHPPSHREFDEVWSEFTNEEDLWVAIITGAGDRAFSAGNDLKYQASGGDRSGMPESGFAGLTSRFNLNKPVIAAVNGVAMGGGMEIALACDLIIASSNARFALPEPKVGLAALAGGMQRLPRQIGMKNAMGMMLTGRHVGAEEAKQLGIVNEVVENQEDLMDAARNWAKQIEACSPMSIRATKQVAYESLNEASLEKSMQGQYSAVIDLFKSEDFIEGPVAFSEKRAPNWKGK
ncbi:MAG TPA: enoyl-CoA hydratase [Gammaproteobacteria bacterium]|jgi:enoyl-CoA hydratase/carnithine racemase|nr:enoyl-CoA hydratase [Gammaproteobacteria bacterium]HIK72713.1 enoyl-CoA hydratase [Gammaproteobacteria bacterium]